MRDTSRSESNEKEHFSKDKKLSIPPVFLSTKGSPDLSRICKLFICDAYFPFFVAKFTFLRASPSRSVSFCFKPGKAQGIEYKFNTGLSQN